jgi:hypothetical protein
MHICLIWTLLVHSILGRFLLLYWDVSFVRLNSASMHKLRERECKAAGIKVWRAVYEVWY